MLREFLEKTVKSELKWMYHYNIEDEAFGIETDKYSWCKRVLDGRATVEELIAYFEQHYGKDEEWFINRLKELC